MNQILYSKNMQKTKIIMIIIILLILILSASFFGYGIYSANNNRILHGVSINNIDMSNLTIDEAKKIIDEKQSVLDSNTYLLLYKNREISFKGSDLDLKYPDNILEKATKYGKDGNIIENSVTAIKSLFSDYDIEEEILLNEDFLKENINILLEEEADTAKDDTYEISGDKILVTKGYDGVVANIGNAKQQILESVNSADSIIKVNIETEVHFANRIDFNELYKSIYVEKKDATYEQNEDSSIKYVEEVVGKYFDKELAETSYLNLKDDEVLTIDLLKDIPEVTTASLQNVLFGDVLATFKTTYNASNVDRSTNLAVSANNINGKILLPGEVFSYNKEVGERTFANGFKEAHVFSGGKVVDGLGGGICQISSTLYNAVLMSNLEIVERKNHMMFPEYVKPSLDATVVWGSIDFKFKNNRETPIKIEASAKNGIATVTIYGKKVENEPIVELESVIEKTIPYTTVTEYDDTLSEGTEIVTQDPVNGYVSKAYKILKNPDGTVISRTLISSDSYRQTSKIVTVGTKKVETPLPPVEQNSSENPSENPNENPNINQNENLNTEIPDEPNNTENPEENNSGLPSGWDTPENPYYD